MQTLEGRLAVVTGAASGIGRATAERLAERGCDLALVDVNAAGLEDAAQAVRTRGRQASTHLADVADRDRMRALADEVMGEHGRVHVLVNNAGVSVGSTLLDHGWEDFDWIVGINFWGVVHGCKFFLPHLLRAEEGHIVNLSSMLGFLGVAGQTGYCSTKFAVRGFSEALHAELAGTRVGITSVHPGAIRTNILRAARLPDEERSRAEALMQRWARPPEAAARKIVRAVERNRLRVVVGWESHLAFVLGRLFPNGVPRLVARASARRNAASPPG